MTPRPTLKEIRSWPTLEIERRTSTDNPNRDDAFIESVGLVIEGIKGLIRAGWLDYDQAVAA